MATTVTFKNNTIATVDSGQTKVLKTKKTKVDADITVTGGTYAKVFFGTSADDLPPAYARIGDYFVEIS
jgi:effector-binding domain-containing protein